MYQKNYFEYITIFDGLKTPEPGWLVGYAAIINKLQLSMPMPNKLSLISEKRKTYETDEWKVFSSTNYFDDTLYKHLVFALKYEGINLLFFKKLFEKLPKESINYLVQIEPTGQYSRKIWFLYEWLMQELLDMEDLKIKKSVLLVDENIQYTSSNSINSSRHRIRNNLPGTIHFCPLIHKTDKLEAYIHKDIATQHNLLQNTIHKDIMQRAAAFLLLKDSKASFTIEGESPTNTRAARWGKAIGQAGTQSLSKEELYRLQQIVIENSRFVDMGFRTEGGFVGEHDRTTGEPMPDHISAKWQDVESLIDGLIESYKLLENSGYNAVLAAAQIAFGFVFIHPFVDGNGRIHRYLIHHILSNMNYSPQGIIFPISASILNHIVDYRKVLESYSHPLLNCIEWKTTANNNIEVLNESIDYYRYFDATKLAEFLYDSVYDTIENIIPQEIAYLQKYDSMKLYLDNVFQMPDKTVALLIRFLEQGDGILSKRAKENEFALLTQHEIIEIEKNYALIFK